MQNYLNLLGHAVNKEGVKHIAAKVEAVKNARAPTNVSDLKSFLGMINFYGKYLKNLSVVLAPLHVLLRKGTPFKCKPEQEKAFVKAKQLLLTADVLVHYHSTKPLVVSCDASPYGLGAVLAHKMPAGSERLITYASRTLTSAERNYSQLQL